MTFRLSAKQLSAFQTFSQMEKLSAFQTFRLSAKLAMAHASHFGDKLFV
jgi:hypothetical protein